MEIALPGDEYAISSALRGLSERRCGSREKYEPENEGEAIRAVARPAEERFASMGLTINAAEETTPVSAVEKPCGLTKDALVTVSRIIDEAEA